MLVIKWSRLVLPKTGSDNIIQLTLYEEAKFSSSQEKRKPD